MIRLTLKKLDLQNPTWSPNVLKPGTEATLKVEAPNISATDTVRFDILRGAEVIDCLNAPAGKTSVKWTALNLTGNHNLMFRATLVEKPLPKNGHSGVLASVTSGNVLLQGFSVAINTIDASFVPKQEKLRVDYAVTDAAAGAKKGRIEIWGERYPGATPAPLYTDDFAPAAGAGNWFAWDGKANAGHLKGKFITPEFSPYRVRLIIGPDSAAVKEPHGAGQGKVAIAEGQFQVVVHSVLIRLQTDIKETAARKEMRLEEVLAVEPRQPDGTYEEMGRLPKIIPARTEIGRLRIPMARHQRRGEGLDQGGNMVGDSYMGGGGVTKYSVDRQYYTRPEIPIEFVPHLRSRDNAINNDVDKRGLHEAEACGPLKIEPVALEHYPATINLAGTVDEVYMSKAALMVKDGAHNAPAPVANVPVYPSWQARFVAVANQRDFDVSTVSPDFGFTQGATELTVYLNRTKLELSTLGNDSELDNGTKHYRELPSGGAGPATTVHLAANKVEANDVVWVVRTTAAGGVTRWSQFPPGPNCHEHYGGVRGILPTAELSNYFRPQYSADPVAPSPLEPIIGKIKGTYPYTSYIQLLPGSAVPQNQQERVEITAVETGSKKGLAGVLFSPSFVCGDQYQIYAWVEHEPYERSFRFVSPKPRIDTDKTGIIQIWRHLQFEKSVRMPLVGAGGLDPGFGMGADAGAPYHGDGTNMMISAMNAQYAGAFHEWTMPDKAPIHQTVNLKKYRKAHNLHSTGFAGKVTLKKNSDVRNEFVRYDYYREELPPNTAFPRAASNAIAGEAKGTPSPTAGAAVMAAIGGLAVDDALDPGVTEIGVYGGTPDQYFMALFGRHKGIAYNIVDILTPRKPSPPKPLKPPKPDKAEPRKMNAVRWVDLHEGPVWNDSAGDVVGTTGMTWEGECMGDGNSLFRTGSVSATLFAHEMGHSTHLVHFVGMNFAWKHHNLNSPGCLMSYTFTKGNIWREAGIDVGPVAPALTPMPAVFPWPLAFGGTDVEHGWPHIEPDPNPPNAPADTIRFGPNIALGGLCAKCLLKLRGWNEELLPVAWSHPDLF